MTNFSFPTDIKDILQRIDSIDPIGYGRTRNFIDGAVTRLSPYISRGVISTRFIMQKMMERGYKTYQIQKFLQELAWRDYFQLVGKEKPELTDTDLRRPQPKAAHEGIPKSLSIGETGIEGIDHAVQELLSTGYMHNHCRMYTASLACNLARCGWRVPSRWMYYHLLDADFASNACSWQWVAGAFSSKCYYADQNNVNKYCYTRQQGTFLDSSYAALEMMETPDVLRELSQFHADTVLPETPEPSMSSNRPVMLYNLYNLDPYWRKDEDAERILLLEPSFFRQYPVSPRSIDFIIQLSRNIAGIQIFTGEFEDLHSMASNSRFIFREHPLFRHYRGICDPREWMFPSLTGYYSSFFAFWKKAERCL